MPDFLVIAGPNGAGKSSFSRDLSGKDAIIFDPDIEKLWIERDYPDISDDAVQEELTRKYHIFEMKAVGNHSSLTVETNLRNDFLAERAEYFQRMNYRTGLIFLLLPDVDHSIKRVDRRVKGKGHFVDLENIKFNYAESLNNLYRHAHRFDEVVLMQSGIDLDIVSGPLLVARYRNQELFWKNEQAQSWSLDIAQNLQSKLDGTEPNLSQGLDVPSRPKR